MSITLFQRNKVQAPMTERQEARWGRINNELSFMELSGSLHPETIQFFKKYVSILENAATCPYSKDHRPRTLTEKQEDHLDALVEKAIKGDSIPNLIESDYKKFGLPLIQSSADGYWREIHPGSRLDFCPDVKQELTSRHPGTGRMRYTVKEFNPSDPAIAFKLSLRDNGVYDMVEEMRRYWRHAARWEKIHAEIDTMELSKNAHPNSVKIFHDYISCLETIGTAPLSLFGGKRTLSSNQEDYLDSLVDYAIATKDPAGIAASDYFYARNLTKWVKDNSDAITKTIAREVEGVASKMKDIQDKASARHDAREQKMSNASFQDENAAKLFKEYIHLLEHIGTVHFMYKGSTRPLLTSQEDHLDSLVERAIASSDPLEVAREDMAENKTFFSYLNESENLYKRVHNEFGVTNSILSQEIGGLINRAEELQVRIMEVYQERALEETREDI